MIIHERCDREIGVIVSFLIPHLHALLQPRFLRSRYEVLRQQLPLLVEVVSRADVDQYIQLAGTFPRFYQLRGVVFGPEGFVVLAEVP